MLRMNMELFIICFPEEPNFFLDGISVGQDKMYGLLDYFR